MSLFRWRKTKQPQAGAEAYAFQSCFENPVFDVLRGPGTLYPCNAISALQPAPAYYPASLPTTAGLGGLIYGTLYGQPLYAPPQNP